MPFLDFLESFPGHETDFTQLSKIAEIREKTAEYKSKTEKFFRWLEEQSGTERTNVRWIYKQAGLLVKRGVVPPAEMYFVLGHAIALRKDVARLFAVLQKDKRLGDLKISTKSHWHFVDALNDTLLALFPTPPTTSGAPNKPAVLSTDPDDHRSEGDVLANRFESLTVEAVTQADPEEITETDISEKAPVKSMHRGNRKRKTGLAKKFGKSPVSSVPKSINDDPLDDAKTFKLYEAIMGNWLKSSVVQADRVCNFLNGVWSRVGSGELSILLGAILTTIAQELFRSDVGFGLRMLKVHDYEDFISHSVAKFRTDMLRKLETKRYHEAAFNSMKTMEAPDLESLTTETHRFALGFGFLVPRAAEMHLRCSKGLLQPCSLSIPRQLVPLDTTENFMPIKISEDFPPGTEWKAWTTNTSLKQISDSEIFREDSYCARMFDCSSELLKGLRLTKSKPIAPLLEGEPFPADQHQFLMQPLCDDWTGKGEPLVWRDVCKAFGITILTESFKAFLMSDKTTKRNCRLELLRYVQEVRAEVTLFLKRSATDKTIEPELRRRFTEWELKLEAFGSERRFDLFAAAPWTCGIQMMQIHSSVEFHGCFVFGQHEIIATVLHLYNALVVNGTLRNRIRLLDLLCDVVEDVVFHGSRPVNNFTTGFFRHIEAMDKWKASVHALGQDLEDSDVKDIPGHMPNKPSISPFTDEADEIYDVLRRIPGTSSLMTMHRSCYKITPNILRALPRDTSFIENLAPTSLEHETNLHFRQDDVLKYIYHALDHEVHGEFPLLKINWLRVFSIAVQVMDGIWDIAEKLYNGDLPSDAGKGVTQTKVGQMLGLLDLADFGKAKPGGPKPALRVQILRQVATCFSNIFSGENGVPERYLWKNL